jgi:hypothetical protein
MIAGRVRILPPTKNRLANRPYCERQRDVARTERTRPALAMHKQIPRLSGDRMHFLLAGIVRYVDSSSSLATGYNSRNTSRVRWVMICRLANAQLIAARIAPR